MEATLPDQLVNPNKPKVAVLSQEKRARMQKELTRLEREYKLIKDERGQKNLVLQFAKNYLVKLLENIRVVRFLSQNYPDILEEFQKIAEMTSLSNPDVGETKSS